jgi:hypothetical protein
MQLQEDLGGCVFRFLPLPEEMPADFQDVTIMRDVERSEQFRTAPKSDADNDFANSRLFKQN